MLRWHFYVWDWRELTQVAGVKKAIDKKALRIFRKRMEGKTVRQIAAEEKVVPTTVINRTNAVKALVGDDERIQALRNRLVDELTEDFFGSVQRGLRICDSSIVNGYAKGLGIYREIEDKNSAGDLTDEELLEKLNARLRK